MVNVQAQIADLFSLAEGRIVFFNPIFEEEEELYGYLAIYQLGQDSETEIRYEYVTLDPRLQEVANGEFVTPMYKNLQPLWFSVNKVEDKMIINRLYRSLNPERQQRTSMLQVEIDLQEKDRTRILHVRGNELKEGFVSPEDYNEEMRGSYGIDIVKGVQDSYLVSRIYKSRMKIGGITRVARFNKELQEEWGYFLFEGRNADDTKEVEFNLEYVDEDVLVLLEESSSYKNLHFIDYKTGKLLNRFNLENNNSEYSHLFTTRRAGEQLVVTGRISPHSLKGYDERKAQGFFQINFDLAGNEQKNERFVWKDLNELNYFKVDKKGRLEDGYRLKIIDIFTFDDGRTVYLVEKYKGLRVNDYVLFSFDPDFKLTNVQNLEKPMNRAYNSDYLFSQEIKSRNGVLFFYEYAKNEASRSDKSWMMGVVKFIDGELTYEEIPMSSEEHLILPYIAKEGYILLREFNKDSDHNQIRLEKINF